MPGNINTIPPSVIAQWPEPNYVDPERRTWLPAFAGAFMGISSVMVLTRFWLRFRKQAGPLGLDDLFLLPGWLGAIAMTVFAIISPRYGSDRHIYDVPIVLFEPLAEAAWAAEFVFVISTGFTKISVLLFYRRVGNSSYSAGWRIATITAIWFTVLYVLAFGLLLLFNCTPLDAYWKSYNLNYSTEYSCVDTSIANPLSGVISVVSDFYSVLLPSIMLRHLDLPKRQKIALNVIFSLGLLGVAAGSARTYYLTKLGQSWDITWTGFNVYIASILEVQITLICAAAPALRVFFRRYLANPIRRTMLSSSRRGDTNADPKASNPSSSDPEAEAHDRSASTEPFAKSDVHITHRPLSSHPTVHTHPSNPSDRFSPDLESGDNSHPPPSYPTDFTALPSLPSPHAHSPALQSPGAVSIDWPLPRPGKKPRVGPYEIKTPADFESYALHSLRSNRPPELGPQNTWQGRGREVVKSPVKSPLGSRMTFLRPPSEESLGSTMGRRFGSWGDHGGR